MHPTANRNRRRRSRVSTYGPNLLCVAPPPVSPHAPPAGPAYLLGYLEANGFDEFDFLDLRLWAPDAHSPTWSYTGAFAESFVLDVPDLPLVLRLLDAVARGAPLDFERDSLFERFCVERGIPPRYLHTYLSCLNRFFETTFAQIPRIDFVGFTTWTTNYLATLLAAAHLKRRQDPPFIIVGGPQVTSSTASGELGVRSGLFDCVALGEGEATLLDAYRQFRETGSVSPGLPGTLSLASDGSTLRRERSLLPLGSLPPPSFRNMHVEAYQREHGFRVLPMQFSRGCTDKCSFCSEWRFWERFRPDTAEHTVSHVRELQGRYGANFIVFMDSLLNGVPARLVDFAETLLRGDVEIQWASFMRAQMEPETAKLLARSGCNDVFIGIESFSDETLALMRKRRTKADNIQALEAFMDAGIGVTAGFVPGFPGDTRQGFLESVAILRDVQERYPGLLTVQEEPFVVQPNSPIYDDLDAMGLEPKPWAPDYLDIAPAYADITSKIHCTVEGESQGLERSGRVSVVRTITESPLSETGFSFERSDDETLSSTAFEFVHLHRGYSLALRKSLAGHVYGLIVDETEQEVLEELAGELEAHASSRRVHAVLSRLERAHVVPPSRDAPLILRGGYHVETDPGSAYFLSPFIVARDMGWSARHRVLLANVNSTRWFQRPARDAELIEALRRRPLTEDQLWNALAQSKSRHRTAMRRTLQELKELGALTVRAPERSRVRSRPVGRARRSPSATRAAALIL